MNSKLIRASQLVALILAIANGDKLLPIIRLIYLKPLRELQSPQHRRLSQCMRLQLLPRPSPYLCLMWVVAHLPLLPPQGLLTQLALRQ